MPQMMPMSWMILYMFFILLMMLFMTKMYFYKKTMKEENMNKNMITKQINWKW
uniref:ATP synthase F0 subunit 8 n=1 Tax=Sipyloidea sipylus TaxID=202427 RepID=E2RV38_SIPSI|nr:ATP synthase F0 subunit 8 [Sipyloidea sipylus]